jgi:ribonuclease HI
VKKLSAIRVYTDGSCKPTNPGPAGFATAILFDNNLHCAASKFIGEATNNVAEISAILFSLEYLIMLELSWEDIIITTDSQYAIGLFQKHWRPRVNRELAKEILDKLELFPNLNFQWVKAHNGDEYNEMVDQMAKQIIDDQLR